MVVAPACKTGVSPSPQARSPPRGTRDTDEFVRREVIEVGIAGGRQDPVNNGDIAPRILLEADDGQAGWGGTPRERLAVAWARPEAAAVATKRNMPDGRIGTGQRAGARAGVVHRAVGIPAVTRVALVARPYLLGNLAFGAGQDAALNDTDDSARHSSKRRSRSRVGHPRARGSLHRRRACRRR